MNLEGQKVVIIGGTSGMGLAAAELLAEMSAEVVISGRSEERLERSLARLPGTVVGSRVDFMDREALGVFFARTGPFDHLVVTATGERLIGPFVQTDLELAKRTFDEKFWGCFAAVQAAWGMINQHGSVTLASGVAGRHAMQNLAVAGAMNAAVDSLVRSLALELAPLRVNAVSPGITDTPFYSRMPDTTKEERFAELEASLPVGRIGQPRDIAQAILFLICNGFTTGTTLEIDGGARLL